MKLAFRNGWSGTRLLTFFKEILISFGLPDDSLIKKRVPLSLFDLLKHFQLARDIGDDISFQKLRQFSLLSSELMQF